MRLLAAALLLLVPAADAAGLTVGAQSPVPDLVPGGAGEPLVLTFGVACADVLPLAASSPTVVITAVDASPNLVLGGELESVVPLAPCQQSPAGRSEWSHALQLAMAAGAPGLETFNGTLVGTIDRPQGVDDLTGQASFQGRAAYVGGIEVEVGTPSYDASTEGGFVLVAIKNTGNAKTTAAFQVNGGPGDLQGPTDVVVAARSSGLSDREIANFTFIPPGGKWTTAQFTIDVRTHAFGALVFKGENATVTATFANTAQPSKDSPAPSTILVPGLLALAFALRRRS